MTRLSYERHIQLLALAAGFPGSLIALIFLWTGNFSSSAAWTLSLLIVAFWLGFAASLRQRVVFSLQTLSNLLAAMREEDFSLRGRSARSDDAMGEVMIEVNALSETLRTQRLGAIEATALLRTVMEEIDLAIFAFDEKSTLRLVNRAAERLLARPSARLLGFTAEELDLASCLTGPATRTMELNFSGGSGRWGLRRVSFRQDGLPHQLIVLSDLSRTLRDEERQAWQRLIRVLGHELNNSLAPIQSVAQSLERGLHTAMQSPELHDGPAAPLLEDLGQGLGIIRSRTEALGRFMAAYAKLARLPQPKLSSINAERMRWPRGKIGNAPESCFAAGTASHHLRRRRPTRAVADQSDSQRHRRRAGNLRWSAGRLVAPGRTIRCVGTRRRSGHTQHRQSFRTFFHHQTRRLRYRPGAQPANRRSPRRRAHTKKSHRR